MKTFLICCYPRSRSLWLSYFFSIPGICVCEHEASEHAASSQEFWQRAEDVAGWTPVYGNSDSANLYVLPALLAARPLTKVVWVERHMAEVATSMRRAGFPFDGEQVVRLINMRQACDPYIDVSIGYHRLEHKEYVRWLWEYLIEEVPFDEKRWEALKDQKLAYTAATLPFKSTDKFMRFLANETEHLKRCQAGKDG
jgi:hypothetical protein